MEPEEKQEIRYKPAENIVQTDPSDDVTIKRRYIEGLIDNGIHLSLVQYLKDPESLPLILNLIGDSFMNGISVGMEMGKEEE